MEDATGSIPVARQPADLLRYGLKAGRLDEAARAPHPVEMLQQRLREGHEFDLKMDTVERIYGSAFAMRLKTERQALGQPHRLPGLPGTRAGLETVLGKDTDVQFEDMLGQPEHRPTPPKFEVHQAMEIKYGFM